MVHEDPQESPRQLPAADDNEETVEQTEELLLQKVLESKEFKKSGCTFISNQLIAKWESHLEGNVDRLLPLTYHACLALSTKLCDDQCTAVWKTIATRFQFSRHTPPDLFLIHLLIKHLEMSFQKAMCAVRQLEGVMILGEEQIFRNFLRMLSHFPGVGYCRQGRVSYGLFWICLATFAQDRPAVLARTS